MQSKTYIIILMVIIALILTFHANIFGQNKEFLEAKTNIIKPDNVNIDKGFSANTIISLDHFNYDHE